MRFRILESDTADGFATWAEAWSSWPGREVMAHPAYARLFARPCDRVVCAAAEDAGERILFPLILRPLAAEPWARTGEARWDAITPYGYGGPFRWGVPTRDSGAFWAAHGSWCREARIVSTFARLSLFPEHLAHLPVPAEERAVNIVVPVGRGAEWIWRGYDKKVRWQVKTAERAGFEVEVDREGRRLEDFMEVYSSTMERVGAADWYRFPPAFFRSIVDGLRGQFAFVHALSRGRVVSSDLVLCSEERVYDFLSGTLKESLTLGANTLVKHTLVNWAAAQGKRECVLGGGLQPGDGIFRYKRAFARHGQVAFRVACFVHDDVAYRELCEDRAAHEERQGRLWIRQPDFFPRYRA